MKPNRVDLPCSTTTSVVFVQNLLLNDLDLDLQSLSATHDWYKIDFQPIIKNPRWYVKCEIIYNSPSFYFRWSPLTVGIDHYLTKNLHHSMPDEPYNDTFSFSKTTSGILRCE